MEGGTLTGFVGDPERQCHGKRVHATRSEARAVVKEMRGYGRTKLGVYRCPHCQQLHLGHPLDGPRSKRRAS